MAQAKQMDGGATVTLEVHLVTPEREVWVGDVEMLIGARGGR